MTEHEAKAILHYAGFTLVSWETMKGGIIVFDLDGAKIAMSRDPERLRDSVCDVANGKMAERARAAHHAERERLTNNAAPGSSKKAAAKKQESEEQ